MFLLSAGLLQNIMYVCSYLQRWGQSSHQQPLALSGILHHAQSAGLLPWLTPAAPVFIQLVMEAVQEEPGGMSTLPVLVLGACSACDIRELGNEVYNWLREHPKEHQQIQAAFYSMPFLNALWATLASHVCCLHEQQAGLSLACGCHVPLSDYCAATGYAADLNPYYWMKQSALDLAEPDLQKVLLNALTISYMLPPGGDVLRAPLLEQQTSSIARSSGSTTSSSMPNGQSSSRLSKSSNICSRGESSDTRQDILDSSSNIQATSSSSSSSSSAACPAGSSTHGLATVHWVFGSAIRIIDGEASCALTVDSSAASAQAISAAPARSGEIATATSSSSGSSLVVATQLQLVLDMLLLTWPAPGGSSPSSGTYHGSSSSKPQDLNTTTTKAKNESSDGSNRGSRSSGGSSSSSRSSAGSRRDGSGGSSNSEGCCRSGLDGDVNVSTSSNKSSSSSSSRQVQSNRRQGSCSHHSWLLLLIGLLQKADAEAKRQFMDCRGGLLLQLLYHAVASEELLPEGFASEGLHLLTGREVAVLLDLAQHDGRKTPKIRPTMFFLMQILLQALLYEVPLLEGMVSKSLRAPGILVNRSGE